MQFIEHKGKWIIPESPTFIRSTLADNIYLSRTDYADRLEHLPDDIKAALLHGDFMMAGADDPLQCIPSAWIKAAMDRWDPLPPDQRPPLTAVGVDVARGGSDKTVLNCTEV